MMRGLLRLFKTEMPKWIVVDDGLWDWTRVFRLPQVTRGGERTWEDPFYFFQENVENRLDPESFPAAGVTKNPEEVIPYVIPDVPKPTPEEVEAILWTQSETGRKISTKWFKAAKFLLQGRECYDAVFKDQPIGEEGERDQTIQRYAGQISRLLSGISSYSPEGIYALLFGSVSFLTPDVQHPDWTETLWSAVLKYYAKEEAKSERDKIKVDSKIDRIVSNMQKWCDHPAIHSDTAWERRQFALEHAICMTATDYYIMQENGFYHPSSTNKTIELPAIIKRQEMDDIIQTEITTEKGVKQIPAATMLKHHGTKVRELFGSLAADGYTIKDIDGANASLVINMYKLRKDLEPKYSDEVDLWLQKLVKPEDWYLLESWLAHSLNFMEGPIAALSLAGAASCGKKMLVRGLEECLDTGVHATGKDFEKFNNNLLKTCFVVVNEGLPKGRVNGIDIADTFRRLTGGDEIEVEPKFKDRIKIRNPLRVIFTSNNFDAIRQIFLYRELTLDDQEALSQRLIHLKAQAEAAHYLKALGGLSYTGKPGRRWVGGDAGQKSDFIVAKHLMWMYTVKRHEYPPGSRFLVEGPMNSSLIKEMKVRAGIAPKLVEAIINLLEMESPVSRGLSIDDGSGKVYMTNSGVMEALRMQFPSTKFSQEAVRKALSSLVASEPIKKRMPLVGGGKSENLVWRELDLKLLQEEAERQGYSHGNLVRLLGGERMKEMREFIRKAEG